MGIGFLDELPAVQAQGPVSLPSIDLCQEQIAFINAYIKTSNINKASKLSKVNKFYHYHWKKDDQNYILAWNLAEQVIADDLLSEARSRGKDGYDYEVLDKDGNVRKLKRYSDNLLMFAIKGLPGGDRYRDNVKPGDINVNISGNDAKVAFDFGEFRKLLDTK